MKIKLLTLALLLTATTSEAMFKRALTQGLRAYSTPSHGPSKVHVLRAAQGCSVLVQALGDYYDGHVLSVSKDGKTSCLKVNDRMVTLQTDVIDSVEVYSEELFQNGHVISLEEEMSPLEKFLTDHLNKPINASDASGFTVQGTLKAFDNETLTLMDEEGHTSVLARHHFIYFSSKPSPINTSEEIMRTDYNAGHWDNDERHGLFTLSSSSAFGAGDLFEPDPPK